MWVIASLTGRFNAHLRDTCLLFADEAYWPGDKGAEGSLKRLITEPELFIEGKGRDGVMVANRLHVIIASNEDWVIPAGLDERRFVVFDVAEHRKQDKSWFDPLYAEMDNGGLEAMLRDLLELDLDGWHPRNIIRTEALREQQLRSLSPENEWVLELLETGILEGADSKDPSCARSESLFKQAREISPRLKFKSNQLLAQELIKRGCIPKRLSGSARG